jgi:MFS transporter, MHS family, shikimate and dehydroshikimate transport protein
MEAASGAHERPDPSVVRRVGLVTAAGSTIEWYDFFIFTTAAALVFPKLFFSPEFSPLAATLASFATLSVGFIARPIGGALWGHYGDKYGRKPSLVAALLVMAIATFLIGVLPSYATIGIAAPLLLTILRFLQGLAVGGQWGGGVLLATEYAPPERRGLFGSFPQLGVPAGLILGNGLFLIIAASVSPEAFLSWGWRVPFLASIVLIAVALYIQLRIEDTPVFRRLEERLEQQQREAGAKYGSPLVDVLRNHLGQVLIAAGVFFVANGAFYVLVTGLLDYGERVLGLPRSTMLFAVLVAAVAQAVTIVAASALSDRVGRKPVYLASCAALAVWTPVMFVMIDTKSTALIVLGVAIALGIHGGMYGPLAALFTEMFSARVRYSGASMGYQLAAVAGGGFAPLIMTSLLAATGTSLSVSAYMFVMCAITFFSTLAVKETYEDEMAADYYGHDLPAGSEKTPAS